FARNRPWTSYGTNAVGNFDCRLLHWTAAWFSELHNHDARFAHQRHDADAHAAVHLGMVYYVVYRIAGIRGSAAGLHFIDSGSRCRNQLLRAIESRGQRSIGESLRRIATSLAAPVLVLRAPGSLHRHLAGGRTRLAHSGPHV